MKAVLGNRKHSVRQILAAIIVVFLLVLTGMAEPQAKHDLSASLPADLSSVSQHAVFTPLY